MADNSDYKKPRTDLFKLLPSVFQSDANKGVFNNAFNRFLTKEELKRISGYAGQGNPNAVIKRQIVEQTPQRQAFQLQPLLYKKIGTVEHVDSYKDILDEITQLGVDTNRLPLWGNALKFNWAPPVDLDKLINYQNYYWYDSANPTSQPQYITIENKCAKAKAKVHQYNVTLDQYGHTFSITAITSTTFSIVGRFVDLFVNGFIFFTKNSTNTSINNRYWTTSSSSFNPISGITTITVQQPIGGTTPVNGIISLDELLSVFQSAQDCACNGSVGWDGAQWDDNQVGNVIWNASLLASISSNTPPGSPSAFDLWYDTLNDQLKQRDSTNTFWNVVQNSFSLIIQATTGTHFWDLDSTCVQESNQWIDQNKWLNLNEVPNFSIAKQAKIPIIEYNSSIELNKWGYINHQWKYRATTFNPFVSSTLKPSLIEMVPLVSFTITFIGGVGFQIIFDSKYGDMTNIFVPGYVFEYDNFLSSNFGNKIVSYSEYKQITAGQPYQTVVTLSITALATTSILPNDRIIPVKTAFGDTWIDYNTHWVYAGAIDTVPVNRQVENLFLQANLGSGSAFNYTYIFGPYSQEFTISGFNLPIIGVTTGLNGTFTIAGNYISTFIPNLQFTIAGSIGIPNNNGTWTVLSSTFNGVNTIIKVTGTILSSSVSGTITPGYLGLFAFISQISNVSLLESGDVRVYVDGIRQYGNYIELDANLDGLVDGIQFLNTIPAFSTVRVEAGEAAQSDLGFGNIPVRTILDDSAYALALGSTQPVNVNLTQYKKIDQVKTQTNQYPLFDMFTVTGGPTYQATPLFAFNEDSSYSIEPNIGRRIARTSDGREYEFYQYLVNGQTGQMYAYRDLSLLPSPYWYDQLNNVIQIWDNDLWSQKTQTTDHYLTAVYSDTDPLLPWINIDGSFWFDTKHKQLFKRNVSSSSWILQSSTIFADVDPTIQTVWRHGLNNETYVPSYVDKDRQPRTIGDPAGDWEIPNQLFYNADHENRQYVNYSQLLTHFNTIIQSQPPFPGFSNKNLFYVIPSNQVNYGLGGTINEYNDSYDTFLSSAFVDNVTPLTIIEFARDEYENNSASLIEDFRKQITSFLIDITPTTIINLPSIISTTIINDYELNDANALIYGDSNTYNSTLSTGVKSWIQTLPFARLGFKYKPALLRDTKLGINEIVHHDGHRSMIMLDAVTIDSITRKVINTVDPRVPTETLGTQQSSAPPSTTTALLTVFSSIRPGIYWFHVSGAIRTLYRLNIAAYSNSPPPFPVPVGTYWIKANTFPLPTLYRWNGSSWVVVTTLGDGIITSAWQQMDINQLAADVILEVETRLYNAAPENDKLAFDFSTLTPNPSEQAVYDTNLENAFNNFVQSEQIIAPFSNAIRYNPGDAFTWNYKQAIITLYPASDNLGNESGGTWQDLYQKLYGTPYPHLEPWKLQGFKEKPSWWDSFYLNITGTRRWNYTHATTTGMWENIRVGRIPIGGTTPNGDSGTGLAGQIPITYTYFSVNIGDTSINGYNPDDLFPPFVSGLSTQPIRSIFYDYNAQIINPGMDYVYGDSGLVEWQWRVSSQFLYDQLTIAYQMQPVRFMHYSFGTEFVDVQELQVDKRTQKVYSHVDAIFHGDIINGNQTYTAAGMNQWYTNFNRFYNFDSSSSDFRQQWAGWRPLLTYQFDSIIDTSTLSVINKNFEVTNNDYTITLKKSIDIADEWVEALKATVLHIPPALGRYETENEWVFEVRTLSPISRTIDYYDVHNYPFSLDITTGIGTLYKFNIIGVDTFNKTFTVIGDETEIFTSQRVFTVADSTGNNGTWTVLSSAYDSSTDTTIISIATTIPDTTVNGYITLSFRTLPWTTGTEIYLSSSENVPPEIVRDEAYYVIMLSPTTFKIAETYNDAINNIPIVFSSEGQGQLYIGQIVSSFQALNGSTTSTVWRHYAIDTRSTLSFVSPTEVIGVQNFINIIDGYIQKLNERGFDFSQYVQQDPNTGRPVNWQVEIERFIDNIYKIRGLRFKSTDKYPVTVNIITNEWTFTVNQPNWLTGTQVAVSTSGTLPSPILPNVGYFIINDLDGTFKLAATLLDAKNGNAIIITTPGSGTLQVYQYIVDTSILPSYEINPIRNNIFLNTPIGLLSNIITGPFTDIRVQQTIFDQYGRLLPSKELSVYREDKVSHIVFNDGIPNDVQPSTVQTMPDPYNYLHMGGAHLLLNGYEHVIIFNDYTTDNALIYDPFVGLSTPKFDLDFERQITTTERPNIGGFFLSNNQFVRNLEASVTDIREFYDTFQINEDSLTAHNSRALLGYEGPKDYLRQINIGDKSQFIFWRGLIKSKGSRDSITAFIRSRRFIDAKVDEFWARKLATFGDSREKIYPQLKLFASDSINQDVFYQFLLSGETADIGFKSVFLTDDTFWFEYPNQLDTLNSDLNLYFDAEVTSLDSNPIFQLIGGNYYYTTSVPCDNVAITAYDPSYIVPIYSTTGGTRELIEGTEFVRINSRVIKLLVNPASFSNIKVYALNPAGSKLNPARIIDNISGTITETVPLWNPALGHHYYNAIDYIKLQNPSDVAEYTTTFNPNNISSNPWNANQVGTTWLDTSNLGYVPYYDTVIFPNLNDRLNNWGKLAEWASVNVYQWIESDVTPDQYVNAGNSGIPRLTTYTRSRPSYNATFTLGSPGIVNTTSTFVNGNIVAFSTTGLLPPELTAGTHYYVVNTPVPSTTFNISASLGGTPINLTTNTGTGTHTIVPAFNPTDWVKDSFIREVIFPALITTLPVISVPSFTNGTLVDVYVNGTYKETLTVTAGNITLSTTPLTTDIIEVIKPIHTVTDAESQFLPDTADDGKTLVEWKADYEYTSIKSIDEITGNTITKYYYWISQSTNNVISGNPSLLNIQQQLEVIPIPYLIYQKFKRDQIIPAWPPATPATTHTILPNRYVQAIIRKIGGIVTDDNRYTLRFTKDFTLRDKINDHTSEMSLKDVHEEWELIRKEQPASIERSLWDKITESIIGYKLTDSTIRVPSLERQLYDETNGTDTQYGLRDGQAFVNGKLALATIVAYLQDPKNDFYPIDISNFLATYTFDTSNNIIIAMDTIYNTFPELQVNRIWFEVLLDALSTKAKYPDIFKTSMVALHGIKILETAGLFDE